MRILLLLALSVPLAGCISVTGPAPIPEWAMNPQGSEAYAEPASQPKRKAAARRHASQPQVARETAEPHRNPAATTDNRMTDETLNALRPTNTQSAELTRPVVRRKPTALDAAAPSRSTEPDWHAHDGDIAHTINSICRGC